MSWRGLVFAAALACEPLEGDPTEAVVATNYCETEEDCNQSNCDMSVHACTVESSKVSGVLVEVDVPNSPSGSRNGDLFSAVKSFPTLVSADNTLMLNPRSRLNGSVYLSLGKETCRPSLVRVTFSPLVLGLGIDAPRYVAETQFFTTIADRQFVDSLVFRADGIADGDYDVFMQDAGEIDNSLHPGCEVAPQIFRGVQLTPSTGERFELKQTDTQVRTLTVDIPYQDELLGYRVDVVHPVTGQPQSSEMVIGLRTGEPKPMSVQGSLRVAGVVGDDWVEPGSELLRLRPPPGANEPSVFLSLAGLEVQRVDSATLPKINPVAQRVTYRAWVWRNGDPSTPVVGKVILNAVKLTGLADLRVEFQTTQTINESGLIEARLPPGVYTLRVLPEPPSLYAREAASQFDTEINVWSPAATAGAGIQSGTVIQVPDAARVLGTVSFYSRPAPPGTRVKLRAEMPSPLRRVPGEFPYVGRDVEAVVNARGDFVFVAVDCGSCAPDKPAPRYTLSIEPPANSNIPWLVHTAFEVKGDRRLQGLELQLPQLRRASVKTVEEDVPDGAAKLTARVFAVVDAEGRLIGDPEAPLCERQEKATPGCAKRAVQIGESRLRSDGSLVLSTPQHVDPYPTE